MTKSFKRVVIHVGKDNIIYKVLVTMLSRATVIMSFEVLIFKKKYENKAFDVTIHYFYNKSSNTKFNLVKKKSNTKFGKIFLMDYNFKYDT